MLGVVADLVVLRFIPFRLNSKFLSMRTRSVAMIAAVKEDHESEEGSWDGICPMDPVVAFDLQFTSGSDLQTEELQVRQLIWKKFGWSGEAPRSCCVCCNKIARNPYKSCLAMGPNAFCSWL